jgi:hypothetical protein
MIAATLASLALAASSPPTRIPLDCLKPWDRRRCYPIIEPPGPGPKDPPPPAPKDKDRPRPRR